MFVPVRTRLARLRKRLLKTWLVELKSLKIKVPPPSTAKVMSPAGLIVGDMRQPVQAPFLRHVE
jgi:hypothetical protein